jgi:A/G-specific adenine glycosylase
VSRDLPWRRTTDPYQIWVSEIMLQQTRVAAVVPYYERFIARFPSVRSLAAAAEADVLTAWAGLGYYARARNLHRAAKLVEAGGAFPRDYESILALPGVGAYTAGAIASIAFNLPHAAVDGNVRRVLSRVSGRNLTIHEAETLALHLLDRRRPGSFNQSLMELGATLCTPEQPHCESCPVRHQCAARAAGSQEQLPLPRKRRATEFIDETLLVIRRNGEILVRERDAFWDLPRLSELPDANMTLHLGSFRHSRTHYRYTFEVCEARLASAPPLPMRWVSEEALWALPVATTVRKAMQCL